MKIDFNLLERRISVHAGFHDPTPVPDWTGTIADWWQANDGVTYAEIANLVRELDDPASNFAHRIGGGAQGCFTIRPVSPYSSATDEEGSRVYFVESSWPITEYVVTEVEARSPREALDKAAELERKGDNGDGGPFWDGAQQDFEGFTGPIRHVLGSDDPAYHEPLDLSDQPPTLAQMSACADLCRSALTAWAEDIADPDKDYRLSNLTYWFFGDFVPRAQSALALDRR